MDLVLKDTEYSRSFDTFVTARHGMGGLIETCSSATTRRADGAVEQAERQTDIYRMR